VAIDAQRRVDAANAQPFDAQGKLDDGKF